MSGVFTTGSADAETTIMEEYGRALKKYENEALQMTNSNLSENNETKATYFCDFLCSLRDAAYEKSLAERTTDSTSSENLLLESYLWSLVTHLIECEKNDSKICGDDDLKKVFYLKKWLESINPQPLRPLNLTKFDTNKPAFEKTESEKTNESTFFQYCFELLLTGDFGKAVKECVHVGNFSMAMIISGYKNNDILVSGNIENSLWRKTTKKLSEDTNLDQYERTIYKYLCGLSLQEGNADLNELLKSSYGWECHLLFYLKAIIDDSLESLANNFKPINIDFEIKNILNVVFEGEKKSNNIKDIMASLILKTENALLTSAKEELIKTFETQETTQFKSEKYLLRVLAHVCIILDIKSPGLIDTENKNMILSTYVSLLRLQKLHSLIPSYIMFFNGPQRLISYSTALNDVVSVEDKEEQKLLALQLGLPYKDALRKMAEELFQELSSDVFASHGDTSMTNTVSDIQKEVINCIDWLMVAGLNNEAIDLLFASIKNFLITGSVGAFRLTVEKINYSSLIAVCHLDNREFEGSVLKHLLELNDCFNVLEEWHDMVRTIKDVPNITLFAEKHKVLAQKLMHCALCFFKDITEEQNIHLFQIKVLYVPYFVIQLHKSLDFASDVLGKKSLAEDALDLAVIVSHEDKETYRLFQLADKLEEYVTIATKTYIKLHDQ